MKRFIAILLAFVLMTAMSFSSLAAVNAAQVSMALNFQGTTAMCSATILDPNKYINATLELWWGTTLIDSWPGSGTTSVSISGSHAVVHGRTYTLKVTGTIGGASINVDPIEKYFA